MSKLIIHEITKLLEKRRNEDRFFKTGVNPFSFDKTYVVPNPYPPPVSQKELDEFYRDTGISLSTDVIAFLQISNGAPGFFGIRNAQKICNLENLWEDFPEWKRQSWLPVGRDTFGNYYIKPVIENSQSPICFVEGTDSNILRYAVASDMLRFALFKLEEQLCPQSDANALGWPFDREYVLKRDPELSAYEDAYPLPWNL